MAVFFLWKQLKFIMYIHFYHTAKIKSHFGSMKESQHAENKQVLDSCGMTNLVLKTKLLPITDIHKIYFVI